MCMYIHDIWAPFGWAGCSTRVKRAGWVAFLFIYAYVHMFRWIYVYIHVYGYMYIYVCIWTYICVYVYVEIHVYARVCIYMYRETDLWFFLAAYSVYGVATIRTLLQIIGLFCKRALKKRQYSAKETYGFFLAAYSVYGVATIRTLKL